METRNELAERVTDILSSILEVSSNELGSDCAMGLTDNWDSFAQLNLILLIEDQFNVVVPDEIVPSLTSLRTIVDWLATTSCE